MDQINFYAFHFLISHWGLDNLLLMWYDCFTSSFGVIGSRDGLKNRFLTEFQFKSENEDLTI